MRQPHLLLLLCSFFIISLVSETENYTLKKKKIQNGIVRQHEEKKNRARRVIENNEKEKSKTNSLFKDVGKRTQRSETKNYRNFSFIHSRSFVFIITLSKAHTGRYSGVHVSLEFNMRTVAETVSEEAKKEVYAIFTYNVTARILLRNQWIL